MQDQNKSNNPQNPPYTVASIGLGNNSQNPNQEPKQFPSNVSINNNNDMGKRLENSSVSEVPLKNEQLLNVISTKATSQQPPQNSIDKSNLNSASPKTAKIQKKPPFIVLFAVALLVIVGILFAALLIRDRGSEVTTEPTDTQGEVVWWGLEDLQVYDSLIKKYESENENTKITYIQQSKENYRERLTNSLAKGEGPDLFEYHNSWIPMFRNELDFMPSFVMSREDFANFYYPIIAADLTRTDGVVGLPLEFDGLVLYINEDIFASAGKSAPVTWDDLKVLAKELTQKDQQNLIIQSGISIGPTDNIDHWQELVAFMIFQNHGTPSNPSSKEASEAMRYYAQLSKDGNWSTILPQSTISFATGKSAMYFGTLERAAEIKKANPSLKFKSVPLPQLRRDDPQEPDLSYASYWVQGVWKRSLGRGVSWRFLKFLSQPENLEAMHRQGIALKGVGNAYPLVSMAPLLKNDKYSGNLIRLAPFSRSWYLADMTFDGPTGINTQFNDLYEPVVNTGASSDLTTFAKKVSDTLAKFGLTK